jgi:hypothetical protein
MDINATLAGQIIVLMVPITAILSYVMAKSRVLNPKKYAIVGAFVGLILPVAIIYLLFLFLKEPEAEYREKNAEI